MSNICQSSFPPPPPSFIKILLLGVFGTSAYFLNKIKSTRSKKSNEEVFSIVETNVKNNTVPFLTGVYDPYTMSIAHNLYRNKKN